MVVLVVYAREHGCAVLKSAEHGLVTASSLGKLLLWPSPLSWYHNLNRGYELGRNNISTKFHKPKFILSQVTDRTSITGHSFEQTNVRTIFLYLLPAPSLSVTYWIKVMLVAVLVVDPPDHVSATLYSPEHSSVTAPSPGQAVKQFTSTRCIYFRKKRLVTSEHGKAVVQWEWPYKELR